ncbi:hypothetical protein [Streptomyces sp. NPDC056817]|uniref:hypothetical protein n=1 Tax=Streptomyces sp. NPDC056817 TaxID=3345950 RepID=UPI0036B38651
MQHEPGTVSQWAARAHQIAAHAGDTVQQLALRTAAAELERAAAALRDAHAYAEEAGVPALVEATRALQHVTA